jgi:glycosyltransferase involved in cell wall biosynthesis
MKVLQLISSAGYYGAENMLMNLIGGDELAVSQNLLAVFHNHHRSNTELYDRAIQRGVRAELFACRGRLDSQGVSSVRSLIRTHAIDLIHTHGYKADLYGCAVARLEGKPLVATCHNWLARGPMIAAYNFLDRIALTQFDAVSAVSQSIAEKLRSFGVRRERISVIPNGIDLQAFDFGPCDRKLTMQARKEPIIGIVARLDLEKGFQYLLRSLRSLRVSFPALRLLIVGEGPDRGKIERLVGEQDLGTAVTFAGQRSDMPAVYSSIDIFVLPSLNEGLPMTVLEAMAASKPIVATRVGAIPTVIADEETGLLIEPADEAGLTRALARLLGDPGLCRRLAQKARVCVEHDYSASTMIQRYRELYRVVLARRHGRQAPLASALAAADGTSVGRAASAAVSSRSESGKRTAAH